MVSERYPSQVSVPMGPLTVSMLDTLAGLMGAMDNIEHKLSVVNDKLFGGDANKMPSTDSNGSVLDKLNNISAQANAIDSRLSSMLNKL